MTQDVAVVTGAAGGLGSALVEHFVARGDRVVAVARKVDDLAALVKTHGDAVVAAESDLTDPDSVAALWDGLDADGVRPRWLVNAVGGYRDGTVEASDAESYAFMMDLNLSSAWWSSRAALPRMKESHGCIVNISSRAAIVGSGEAAAYAVSKAAVTRLTEVLAEDLFESDLRVNAVIPAIMDTPDNAGMPEKVLVKAVPPADVAAVIGFLCSEAAAPITGAAIPVYGRFPKPYRS